uniref:Uncharacterized protein n=1 Tax=Attheya septentrionalis TaxID=420275 RepID=A0A7S2UHW5_9STRA|mmetsp:Transcript_26268/g.47656  ORF Transcript_26268/g.47656 Transcript_26268/m.47656 type:complete len:131 (+) Transcript_26268:200-592(+)|eukprot:CAMPEP_0198304192 /NCGR_PEP_ID=MMETSP1449-20131203/57276_1 /TAXON_ID=420275 /ORGANISM="Attheya septentrionalis, Strain CCMP2084" /LENGTH=130 /DNA_ID=CAMNT_0044006707 /DNA_START=149 /DNA_END=544 /DNA_ORIENTATION=-
MINTGMIALDKNKNKTTMISGGAPNARAKLSRLPLLLAVLVTLLLLPGAHGQNMKKRTLKGKSSNVVCDGLEEKITELEEVIVGLTEALELNSCDGFTGTGRTYFVRPLNGGDLCCRGPGTNCVTAPVPV